MGFLMATIILCTTDNLGGRFPFLVPLYQEGEGMGNFPGNGVYELLTLLFGLYKLCNL